MDPGRPGGGRGGPGAGGHAVGPGRRQLLDPGPDLDPVLRVPERRLEPDRWLRGPVLHRARRALGHRGLHLLAPLHQRRAEPLAGHGGGRARGRGCRRADRLSLLPAARGLLLAGEHRLRRDAPGGDRTHRHRLRRRGERRARPPAPRPGPQPGGLPVRGQAVLLLRHAGAAPPGPGGGLGRETLAPRILPGGHPRRRGGRGQPGDQSGAGQAPRHDPQRILHGHRRHVLRAVHPLHHADPDHEPGFLGADGDHGRAGRDGHRPGSGLRGGHPGAHRRGHAGHLGRELARSAPHRVRRAPHGGDPLLPAGDRGMDPAWVSRQCPLAGGADGACPGGPRRGRGPYVEHGAAGGGAPARAPGAGERPTPPGPAEVEPALRRRDRGAGPDAGGQGGRSGRSHRAERGGKDNGLQPDHGGSQARRRGDPVRRERSHPLEAGHHQPHGRRAHL